MYIICTFQNYSNIYILMFERDFDIYPFSIKKHFLQKPIKVTILISP